MARKITLVARLLLEHNGKILFLAQTTQNGGKYSLVGGKIESEETATEALARESLEECGLVVHPLDMKLVHVLHRNKSNETMIVLYFKPRAWSGDLAVRETKKFKRVNWFPSNDLPKNISRITKNVLQRYHKGEMFTEHSTQKAAERNA
jgi:ADP-ribose pyrophosphatase YjhB (NUDIX family)